MGLKQTVSVRLFVFVESSLAGSGLQRLRLKGNNVLDLLYYEQSLCLWRSPATDRPGFELPGQRHHRSEALFHMQASSHQRLVAFVLLIALCFSATTGHPDALSLRKTTKQKRNFLSFFLSPG